MKRAICLLVALLAHGVVLRAVATSRAGQPLEEARALDRVLPRVVERIAPSLLRVRPAGDASEQARHARTAIALEKDFAVMDGLSINVTGVDDLVVEDAAGKVHKAIMRGRDARLRVVSLVVEDGELVPAPRSSRTLEAGAFVVSVGTVTGKPNATFGIVSALGRFEGRALQVDCNIDPANAGGATCDLDGNLVGVPVLLDHKLGDDSGVGFAVPVGRILPVIDRLRNGDEIQPGFMGVRLPDDDTETTDGVKIARIIAEGPAEKAGLKANDVIVELDEQKVSSLKGLLTILSRRAAGDSVTVKVLREGHEKTVELKLVAQ